MNTLRTTCRIALVSIVVLGLMTVCGAWLHAAGADGGTTAGSVTIVASDPGSVLPRDTAAAIVYAVAITMGVACLSAGYAVGKVGAAALGAAAERPEILGRALIFVGLAEGIAIYGLIIAIMLIGKLG